MLSDKMSELKYELEKKGLLNPCFGTLGDYYNPDSICICTDNVTITITESLDTKGGFVVSNVGDNYSVLNEDMLSTIECVDVLVSYA